jgi:anti-sigma B factor antagonist
MEVKINKQDNNTTEVRLEGRLDTPTAQEVNQRLLPVQEDASGTIILDCEELTYISSSGLRVFLTLRKAAAMKGGKVIIRNINDNIRNVFMMTGFLNLFDIE